MSLHPDVVRSRANPALKRAGAALAGKAPGTLVLEGERLVADAIEAGWELELVLAAADRPERARAIAPHARETRLVEPGLLARVSGLKTSPGLLALAPTPAARSLTELPSDGDALVLVVSAIADPGNLGALARAAEAAGTAALVVVRGGVSPWSPKALRGSMGSLLRLPVHPAPDADSAAATLAERGYRQVVAATRGGVAFDAFDWSGSVALWLTAETGPAPAACAEFEPVSIPMAGAVESLNVSVAGALLLFAARRTREDAS